MKNLGVLISLKAKSDQTEVVAKLLQDAVGSAQKENETLTWYSFRMDKETFGIFDTFNDEGGREAHLKGEITKILNGKAEELLIQPPEITKIDILSSK